MGEPRWEVGLTLGEPRSRVSRQAAQQEWKWPAAWKGVGVLCGDAEAGIDALTQP